MFQTAQNASLEKYKQKIYINRRTSGKFPIHYEYEFKRDISEIDLITTTDRPTSEV